MATDKTEIKEFAKNLYLAVNETGGKAYSNQAIANELLQKGYKKVTRKTIGEWAKKDNWDLLLQTAKNIGIIKAVQESTDKESAIIEAQSNNIADLYQTETRKYKESAELILKAIAALKTIDPLELRGILNVLAAISNNSLLNLIKLNEDNNADDKQAQDRIKEFYDRYNNAIYPKTD